MSEEENKNYVIDKSATTDVQTGNEVHIEAPNKKEAKELFDEVWNDD